MTLTSEMIYFLDKFLEVVLMYQNMFDESVVPSKCILPSFDDFILFLKTAFNVFESASAFIYSPYAEFRILKVIIEASFQVLEKD